MKLIESLKCPKEKNIYNRERLWGQISGKDVKYWTDEKNEPFITSREKDVQEKKYNYNSLPGLAVNCIYIVIINTSYSSN